MSTYPETYDVAAEAGRELIDLPGPRRKDVLVTMSKVSMIGMLNGIL